MRGRCMPLHTTHTQRIYQHILHIYKEYTVTYRVCVENQYNMQDKEQNKTWVRSVYFIIIFVYYGILYCNNVIWIYSI